MVYCYLSSLFSEKFTCGIQLSTLYTSNSPSGAAYTVYDVSGKVEVKGRIAMSEKTSIKFGIFCWQNQTYLLSYNHSKGNRAESTGQEVNEMEIDSMTQTELASYLETLAKLVEATAKDPQDAARIIREAIPKQ